jgi:hypothetical protein
VRLPVDRLSQGSEVGNALLVLHDDLAIDERRAAAQLAAGLHHWRIFVAPVETIAGQCPNIAAVDAQERKATIVLNLVNPAPPLAGSRESIRIWGAMNTNFGEGDTEEKHRCRLRLMETPVSLMA